jgi:hypothetical protein
MSVHNLNGGRICGHFFFTSLCFVEFRYTLEALAKLDFQLFDSMFSGA